MEVGIANLAQQLAILVQQRAVAEVGAAAQHALPLRWNSILLRRNTGPVMNTPTGAFALPRPLAAQTSTAA
jgi:hypothetical protein